MKQIVNAVKGYTAHNKSQLLYTLNSLITYCIIIRNDAIKSFTINVNTFLIVRLRYWQRVIHGNEYSKRSPEYYTIFLF